MARRTGFRSISTIPSRAVAPGSIEEQRRRAGLPVGGNFEVRGVGDTPEFEGLQQEQLAPGVSTLQRGLRELGAQRFGSLTEREATLRGATRGAGEALGSLQAAAARTAEGIGMGRSQFALQREALATRERERGEDLARLRSRDLGSSQFLPPGIGGGRLGTAFPQFQQETVRPSPFHEVGATREERAATEAEGLRELQALAGDGIEQQLGGVF